MAQMSYKQGIKHYEMVITRQLGGKNVGAGGQCCLLNQTHRFFLVILFKPLSSQAHSLILHSGSWS